MFIARRERLEKKRVFSIASLLPSNFQLMVLIYSLLLCCIHVSILAVNIISSVAYYRNAILA